MDNENEIRFEGNENQRKVLAIKMLADKWDSTFHDLIGEVSKACGLNPFEIAPAFLMHELLEESMFAKKEAGIIVNLEGYGKAANERLKKIKCKIDKSEILGALKELMGDDLEDVPEELKELLKGLQND